MNLQGKVAVVTGSGGGIGSAVCKAFRDEGMIVHGLDLPDGFDVRKFDIVKQAFDHIGHMDVLINNAGVSILEPLDEITLEHWYHHIDINLNGVFNCCKAALPHIHGGDIISMASRAAVYAHPGHAAYCASKAAVVAFSEAIAMDVRKFGIRVGYLMPGPVSTGFAGQPEAEWKIDPENIAEIMLGMIRLPRKASFGRVEVKPSFPK